MNIPENIKIRGMEYKIVRTFLASSGIGSHINWKAVIRIEEDMSPEKIPSTLWHEVLHALLTMSGLGTENLSDEERAIEEKIITALSYGISEVLEDNPWMREL